MPALGRGGRGWGVGREVGVVVDEGGQHGQLVEGRGQRKAAGREGTGSSSCGSVPGRGFFRTRARGRHPQATGGARVSPGAIIGSKKWHFARKTEKCTLSGASHSS